jgi:ribosomal protein S18 acetylase RimI-like enzyme
MWLDYIRERMPMKDVIETAEGFVIYYNIEAERAVYIEEIYIKPQFRRSDIGSSLMRDIIKESVMPYMMGSIDVTTEGTAISLKAMLKQGFEPYRIEGNLMFLRKEL